MFNLFNDFLIGYLLISENGAVLKNVIICQTDLFKYISFSKRTIAGNSINYA